MYEAHPWLFLSALSGMLLLACLVIPLLRRYALQGLVIPIAFGLCAPLGSAIAVRK